MGHHLSPRSSPPVLPISNSTSGLGPDSFAPNFDTQSNTWDLGVLKSWESVPAAPAQSNNWELTTVGTFGIRNFGNKECTTVGTFGPCKSDNQESTGLGTLKLDLGKQDSTGPLKLSCAICDSTTVEQSKLSNQESARAGPFGATNQDSTTVGTTSWSACCCHKKHEQSPAPHQYKASFAQGQEIAQVGQLNYTTAVALKQERRLAANRKHLLKNKKKNAAIHFDSKLNSHKSYRRPLLSQYQRTRAWLNQANAIVQQSTPTQVHPQLAPGIV
jgi:hypothetical protein